MPNTPIQVPNIANLRRIDSDTVIYVSPNGNDSTGVGTTAAPYQSLGKAMSVAREYTIAGTAVLTVRLLRGEYTLSSNIDLYHPQGANLVIEGDPDAFRQRTLYKVDSYTWNLANFAGGGHTGTIRVFDGTTAGTTFHGFTAVDQGMYFTIVNAAIGARSNYKTNGASGGTAAGGIHGPVTTSYDVGFPYGMSSYTTYFYGDRFFNAGFSYEEGNAVLGIGRILGATTSGTSLSVQFNNVNYDGRCPAWMTEGGLANGQAWCTVASNYPETQYSEPNGYYGWDQWKSENGTVVYPSRVGGDRHITTDPYILSTYPVVLRANYTNNDGTLYLKNGTLRGLRNIFFASNQSPYTLHNGATGATLNWTQAITSVTENGWSHTRNGTALALENSTVGIRHLGFLGIGTAISAYGSKISKYSENTLDTQTSFGAISQTEKFAVMNSLDNAPVICTTQCGRGIIGKSSTIDFTDGSALCPEHGTDYRDGSVYLDCKRSNLSLYNTEFSATSVVCQTAIDIPTFSMVAHVPVFPGTTATSGATVAFNAYTNQNTSTANWHQYPLVTLKIAGLTIGYVNSWSSSTSSAVDIGGATSGSSYVGSINPVSYTSFNFYGVKVTPTSGQAAGLSYMNLADLRRGITHGNTDSTSGSTLEMLFYRDVAGTSLASSLTIGQKEVLVRGANGYTLGVQNIAGTSGAGFLQNFLSTGTDTTWGGYADDTYGVSTHSVLIGDRSNVGIEKVLWITNGGVKPVKVYNTSVLHIGDAYVLDQPYPDSPPAGGITPVGGGSGWNYSTGVLCINGWRGNAVHVADNSSFRVGGIFAKHPSIAGALQTSYRNGNFVPQVGYAQVNSSFVCRGAWLLLHPALTSVLETSANTGAGQWGSRTGTKYGVVPFFSNGKSEGALSATFYATKTSTMFLVPEGAIGNQFIFMFDSGSPSMSSTSENALFFAATNGGRIQLDVNLALDATTSVGSITGTMNYRRADDPRSVSDRKIATRSGGVNNTFYNTIPSSGVRAWRLPVPVPSGATYTALPCGMVQYAFQSAHNAAAGTIYCNRYDSMGAVYISKS